MPYIKQERRKELTELPAPKTPGELNYLLTVICRNYISARLLSYQTINDVMGALEGAKLEFYRRVAAPYEDIKIRENGDVY